MIEIWHLLKLLRTNRKITGVSEGHSPFDVSLHMFLISVLGDDICAAWAWISCCFQSWSVPTCGISRSITAHSQGSCSSPGKGDYCFCWSQLWVFSGKEDRNLESNSLQPCLAPALSTLLTWQMSSGINPPYIKKKNNKKNHTVVPDKCIWSNNFCGHFVCYTQVSKFSFNK